MALAHSNSINIRPSSDSLSTHQSHFGTLQKRPNGHVTYEQDRYSTTDYENGILPLPPEDLTHHKVNPMFAHLHPNNGPNVNPSDTDSWIESSRSRETSPSSSIPPGLPSFRVIPLCDSESSGTHLSDPNATAMPLVEKFPRNSSNMGSDLGSNPDKTYGLYGNAKSASEAGSNGPSDNWGLDSGTVRPNGSANGMTNGGASGQPLLRRNQYWV